VWRSALTALRYSSEGPGIHPRWCNSIFFRGIRQFHVSGVDSTSKNEYQDTPGGKDGRVRMADNLPPSSVDVTKSGNLNLPEPSGANTTVMGLLYLFTVFYLTKLSITNITYRRLYVNKILTLSLLMSYIYGAPSKARILTYCYRPFLSKHEGLISG
jgi:hypothetical protein